MHAVAVGPDGRVYAGTSPDGAVYAIDAAGQATRFFDPAETYIWALAFDRAGALYVATGGEGRVHRVSADGKSETVLTSTETHVLSLAIDARGRVYAGSAPEGLVYRIDGPGKVFVLLDSAFREIKALDVGEDGSLYAAAIDGRTSEPPARATAAPAPPAPGRRGRGDGQRELRGGPGLGGAPVTVGASGTDASSAPSKGALLRIRPTGEIDTLWSSPEDVPHSRASAAAPASSSARETRARSTASATTAGGQSWRRCPRSRSRPSSRRPRRHGPRDPRTRPGPGPRRTLAAEGTFVSKVKDTETVSSWGRLAWEAACRPARRCASRRGQATRRRRTPPGPSGRRRLLAQGGEPIPSENARFLQLRVALGRQGRGEPDGRGRGGGLPAAQPAPGREVDHRALRRGGLPEADLRDRRARDPGPGADPRSDRAAAHGPPPAARPPISFSRKLYQRGIQTFSWQADDPNGDALLFDVLYRAAGDERWRPCARG